MDTLPEYILVVVCKYSELDKEGVSEILKEYLSGMPYLQCASSSLYDINDTCYILPYTNTLRGIMYTIVDRVCIETIDVLGYAIYEHCNYIFDTYTKTINDKEVFNYHYFPLTISIDSNDIPKLHSLQD